MHKELLKEKLKGPIFSIITPFKKNENIDYQALSKYIKYLYIRGARCFYVMVYNSRLSLLDEQEIIKLNLFVIKCVKKINKENVVICAEPYHTSTKKSLQLVNLFYKNGADIVSLIFGEKFYSENQIFSHFKKIDKLSKCKLLLHQQPFENGISSNPPTINYSVKLLKRIAKLDKFIAMKEDAKNEKLTIDICKSTKKDLIIITSGGGKRQWLKAAKFGCQSWLSGISNLDPKIALDFYDFYKKKEKKEILKIIKKLEDPFFKIKNKYGWHLTIKAMLESKNIFNKFERAPLVHVESKAFKDIKKVFMKMKKNSITLFKSKYIV
jgi:4-hydroxy-tetrahydrodipicolinate synthase